MKNSFFILILLSITTAWFMPAIENTKELIPYFLGLSIFLSFLSIRDKIAFIINKNRVSVLLSFSLRFVFTPLLFSLIFRELIDEVVFFSILLVVIAPTGLGAILLAEKFKNKKECVATDVIVQNFAAIVMIPLLLSLYGTDNFSFTTMKAIFLRLIPMIIVPFTASKIVQNFVSEKKVNSFKKGISRLNSAAIVIIIFAAANISFATIKTTQTSIKPALISAGLLSLFHFAAGFAIKNSFDKRVAMSVIFGYRNTSLTVWIAVSFFNPAASLTAMFYIIFQHIFNSTLLYLNSKNTL